MREIKFRAWSVIEKMIYFTLHDLIRNRINRQHLIDYPNLPKMQYTGLKDKNGKEIYEGDILNIDGDIVEVKPPELFECDAFVVYGYKFCSGFFSDNYDKVGLDRFYSEKPEIIGNIYENPCSAL